jgi:hypothetical protein
MDTSASTSVMPSQAPPSTTDSSAPTQVLFSNDHTTISFDPSVDSDGKPSLNQGFIYIETSDEPQDINITVGPDNTLTAYVNGTPHKLPFTATGEQQYLSIFAGAGNDRIRIDPRVEANVLIHAGDGNDVIFVGGGQTSVFGGPGNDYIMMGSGAGVAHGEDGDDVLLAGTGHASLSGGKGDDQLYAMYPNTPLRQVFLNGDQGNDRLYAGTGKNVLNGGPGDDTLVGHRHTAFYTGAGKDTVKSYSATDKIYAKTSDTICNTSNAAVTHIQYNDSGRHGLKIEGSEYFIEQVENYLEQLRGSPAGQVVLAKMDSLAQQIGAPVTIKMSEYVGRNDYAFRNTHTDNITVDDLEVLNTSPKFGYIKEGKAGSVATHALLHFHTDAFNKDIISPPVIALFHELIHAFNGGTGTFIPGTQAVVGEDGKPVIIDGEPMEVENSEYQAIGLETQNPPFDFDNNPLTPPTSTNPAPFTENAVRAEMGVPLRDRYQREEPPQKTP